MKKALFAIAIPALAIVYAWGEPDRRTATVSGADSHEPAPASAEQARRLRLQIDPAGSEVRYRVKEQLANLTLPNDAVGKTKQVSGNITIESNGRVVKEESKFTVLLDSIASDQSRRDNYVRRNTLSTAQFPTAQFVPTGATGLPATLPAASDLSFKLMGDFTVKGVTKPTTWDVKGKMLSSGEFTGTATTWFKFGDFELAVPRVALVLSIVDSINIEMDLHLIPAPPTH